MKSILQYEIVVDSLLKLAQETFNDGLVAADVSEAPVHANTLQIVGSNFKDCKEYFDDWQRRGKSKTEAAYVRIFDHDGKDYFNIMKQIVAAECSESQERFLVFKVPEKALMQFLSANHPEVVDNEVRFMDELNYLTNQE